MRFYTFTRDDIGFIRYLLTGFCTSQQEASGSSQILEPFYIGNIEEKKKRPFDDYDIIMKNLIKNSFETNTIGWRRVERCRK